MAAVDEACADLTAEAPHGGIWDRSQVRRIAANPAYIARRRVGLSLVESPWEPIADTATWHAAQAVLAAQADAYRQHQRAPRPGRARWLLSYVATCGPCGSFLMTYTRKGYSPAYQCSDPHKHCVYVNVREMDALVRDIIIERCQRGDIWQRVVEGGDEAVGNARNEAAELRDRLREYRKLAIDGKISPESFAEIEAELTAMIADAEKNARMLSVPLPLRVLAEPGADVAGRWDNLCTSNIAACREIVRIMLSPVKLWPSQARKLDVHQRVTIRD